MNLSIVFAFIGLCFVERLGAFRVARQPNQYSVSIGSFQRDFTSALRDGAAEVVKEAEVVKKEEPASTLPQLDVLKKTDTAKMLTEGTSYIMCSSCKSAFAVNEDDLGKRGKRVRCGVCEKEWFQSGGRMLHSDNQHELQNMTDVKVEEIRRAIQMRNWPKYPKVDKVGVFVGNLPYEYGDEEIGDIFAEYGVTGISLVRDPTGLSKGFAFVEVMNSKDADKMIEEMHHFHTDENRRLTVRLATQPGQGPRGAGGGGNRGPRSDNNGGGGRGGAGGRDNVGGGKVWQPRSK